MTNQPKLIASLYGGLGNRLKPLLTCEHLADELGMDYRVVWRKDHRFTAELDKLWVTEYQRMNQIHVAVKSRRIDTVVSAAEARAKFSGRDLIYRHHDAADTAENYPTWETSLTRLRPHVEITEAVNGFWDKHLVGTPYIGVMVRAHKQSHPNTKSTSPVQWFVDRMQKLSSEYPDLRFFLSCDDAATQQQIISAVPNVVAQQKSGRYNSSKGVQEAIIDLYLLAFADRIIGPAWSTFIHMADALRIPSTSKAETPLSNEAEVHPAPRVSAVSDLRLIYGWFQGV